MKYIDSIHDSETNLFLNANMDGALLDNCKGMMALLEKGYEDTLQLIVNEHYSPRIWKSCSFLTQIPVFKTLDESHQVYSGLLLSCSEMLLLAMDVNTAFRYLLEAKDDWDYRFFARRIYTLMHETQPVLGRQGDLIKNMHEMLGDSELADFENTRKDLFKYINDYDASDFKPVRNGIEAHRDNKINIQFESIHNMSVKRSSEIILDGHKKLMSYSYRLLVSINKITDAINEIVTFSPHGLPVMWDFKNKSKK